jgi:hypothetical protein
MNIFVFGALRFAIHATNGTNMTYTAVMKAEFETLVLICPKVCVKKLKNKRAPAIEPYKNSLTDIFIMRLKRSAKTISAPIVKRIDIISEGGIPESSEYCTATKPAPQRTATNTSEISASLILFSDDIFFCNYASSFLNFAQYHTTRADSVPQLILRHKKTAAKHFCAAALNLYFSIQTGSAFLETAAAYTILNPVLLQIQRP